MLFQQPSDRTNLYRILDRRSINKITLIKSTFSIYKKNFFNLIKLFFLSALFIFFVFATNSFLPTTPHIITDENIHQTHNNYSFFKYSLFVISLIIFISGTIFSLFATIKIIHTKPKNLKIVTKKLVKNLHSIVISILMGAAVMALTIFLISALSSFLLTYYKVGNLLLAKILLSLLLIPIILILTDIILRLSLFAFVIIIEEKYLFKPLIHSLTYTKSYVITLIKKIIFMLTICIILSLTSYNLIYGFLGNIDINHEGKTILSIIGLIIPIQLFIISYYVIYKLYSADFPEKIRLTSVQEAKLKVAVFAMLGLIITILFPLLANFTGNLITNDEVFIKFHHEGEIDSLEHDQWQ